MVGRGECLCSWWLRAEMRTAAVVGTHGVVEAKRAELKTGMGDINREGKGREGMYECLRYCCCYCYCERVFMFVFMFGCVCLGREV